MTLTEIKTAVLNGKTVHCGTHGYIVLWDAKGAQWLIHYLGTDYYIGLTHRDGITLNNKEENFFVCNLHNCKGASK